MFDVRDAGSAENRHFADELREMAADKDTEAVEFIGVAVVGRLEIVEERQGVIGDGEHAFADAVFAAGDSVGGGEVVVGAGRHYAPMLCWVTRDRIAYFVDGLHWRAEDCRRRFELGSIRFILGSIRIILGWIRVQIPASVLLFQRFVGFVWKFHFFWLPVSQ